VHLLAQATIGERSLVITGVFAWVLLSVAIVYALFVLIYVFAGPIVSPKARRVMTGYVIAGPLILLNLVIVFALFVGQFVAVQWIYGSAANPQRVLETAFRDAGPDYSGQPPLTIILDEIRGDGPPSPFATGFTKVVWFCLGGANWAILFFLVFAMLRDLGVTSWSLIAAPYQREIHNEPWWDLIKRALSRFLYILLYTIFAGGFFALSGIGVMSISWLILRMVAGTLVTYIRAVEHGGTLAFILFGTFYVTMLEILGLLFIVTGLLSFIASRSISLNIEKTLAQFFGTPVPTVSIPKLWPPLKGAALLMGKVFLAMVPIWLVMAFPIGMFFPLFLSAPVGAVFHVIVLNLILGILRIDKDLKPLLVEGWAGRPWATSKPAADAPPAPPEPPKDIAPAPPPAP
jgi:hypothetical protein